MTAIIIEDEIPAGKRLEKLLIQNGFTVLTIIVSIKNAMKWFSENNMPDYVFADVKLRDGNSFQLFEKVTITSKIVFTTAYDEFALKAFDCNAIDYLLKPIDEKKLCRLISKITNLKDDSSRINSSILKESFQEKHKSSFLISIGNSLKKIENHEIMFFFSEDNSTFLKTNGKRIFPMNISLEKLEQILNPNLFFRISRKHLINRNHIDKIHTKNQLYISLQNHEENLKVSRLKMKLFLEWYEKSFD